MLRSNCKQYGEIHVEKHEEGKGKAAVGRIGEKEGIKPGKKE